MYAPTLLSTSCSVSFEGLGHSNQHMLKAEVLVNTIPSKVKRG